MANWVKYKDQPRLNLDNYCSIVAYENDNRIAFYNGNVSIGEYYIDRWEFETEEEARKCREWLDKIIEVKEFGAKITPKQFADNFDEAYLAGRNAEKQGLPLPTHLQNQ